MTYSNQPWNQRVGTLGDIAEGIFEQVAPLGSMIPYGLRRPPFRVKNLNSFQRNTPDYLTANGEFVEVMGCGRDGVVKLKLEKWEAQKQWAKQGPLRFFLWNSNTQEWAMVSSADMAKLVTKGKRKDGVQEFQDGNQYVGIDWEWLDTVFSYAT